MSVEFLEFDILPRFYILCFYRKDAISEIPAIVKNTLEQQEIAEELIVDEILFNEIFAFPFKSYTHLGYIEIDFKGEKELKNVNSKYGNETYFSATTINGNMLYQFSLALEKITEIINREHPEIFLDVYNPPYIATTALNVNINDTWDENVISKYKKSIGKWTEFYSGQFDDYSEKLWESRIKDNLSNRVSELHYIRENSAFIFMPIPEFIRNFSYMENFFLKMIVQVKALKFAIYMINIEIDETNKEIESYGDEIPLVFLETKIVYVNKLGKLINKLNAHFFKDKIINRRAHGKRILYYCYDIFDIVGVKQGIDEKLNILNKDLDSARTKRQEELSAQSRKWIIVLNLILGSQVIFTLRDEIIDKFHITAPDTISMINVATTVSVVIAVGVAVIGLGYTWAKHRFGWFKAHKETLE